MKTKTRFVIVAAIVLTGSAAGFTLFRHQATGLTAASRRGAVSVVSGGKQTLDREELAPPAVAPPLPPPPVTDPAPLPLPPSPALSANGAKLRMPAAKSNQKPLPQPKEPIQDPMARQALGAVGADSLAEQYWVSAINDLSLPPDERKDLIEDLNEDGFTDPDHLSREDVPMILNRLQLIEDLAPDALDQVNNDAFQEAYKDLLNMLAKAP